MENKKKEKQQPSDSLSVKIGMNEYSILFSKITNGQLIDIESAKVKMTGGANKDMPYGARAAQNAYVLVEAIATFENLLPELKKDLLVGSLLDLNKQSTKSVLKAYEKYYEWMNKWEEFLNDDVE